MERREVLASELHAREGILRCHLRANAPLPAWWTIVISGRCRMSQPARFIRKQRSGSSL